jgi:hypothetical protein
MDFPLAPRTDSYLTNHLGFKTVSAPAWPSADSSGPVLLDPVGMPLAGAPRTVCVVGEPSTSDAYIIRRYREDPDDGPKAHITWTRSRCGSARCRAILR